MVSEVKDINTDPGCRNATNPNMAPHHSLGLDVTRVWDDSTGPSGSVALEDQYGLACLTRSQSSAQPLVVTEDTDINTDPGCYSAIDRDIRPPPVPAAAQAQMSSCFPVVAPTTQINMATGAA